MDNSRKVPGIKRVEEVRPLFSKIAFAPTRSSDAVSHFDRNNVLTMASPSTSTMPPILQQHSEPETLATDDNSVEEDPQMIVSTFEAMNASRRNTMEDVYIVHPPGTWGYGKDVAYLAVYDGHGGKTLINM